MSENIKKNNMNGSRPAVENKGGQKPSVACTVVTIILYVLAALPLFIIPIVIAAKSSALLPAYGVWHFIGFIVLLVFTVIYAIVVAAVTRKKSKSSMMGQTVKIVITYICLTTVFGLLLTYVAPDIVANATSSTLFAEDVYYLGDEQLEENAALERQFIMYNVLNGNMNIYDQETGAAAEHGDFSYATLESHSGAVGANKSNNKYSVPEVKESFDKYFTLFTPIGFDDSKYANGEDPSKETFDQLKKDKYKYELYQFIYQTYVLNDVEYSFAIKAKEIMFRRAITLAITDYIYKYGNYEDLVANGFRNAKLKQLFQENYDNFNQDGYQTFDDPLLLYAQLPGRMTVPVVLRLILNKGWTYTQPTIDETGTLQYTEEHNFLYEHYEPQTVKAYRDANPGKSDEQLFPNEGKLLGADGKEYNTRYGYNEDGWMVYANGVVKRPINWLVLDMLGDPMAITSMDVTSLAGTLSMVFASDQIKNAIGGLLQDDVGALIETATNGAGLGISLYIDDAKQLQIQIMPMNAKYGMLGYMQATWVQSNNLLMAVINVFSLRNWLYIFGGIGAILIIIAGAVRECDKRAREKSAVAGVAADVHPADDSAKAHAAAPKAVKKAAPPAHPGARPAGSKPANGTRPPHKKP